MKIIISNRINNLPNETIDNAEINLTALITALWETSETQRSKFSSFMHKGKTLDADKIKNMLLPSGYSTLKSIDTKKIYPRRLHSVSLKGNLNWEVLQIDETSYLKYREKNPSFLPNLIRQHAQAKNSPKSSIYAPAIPEFMMESPLPKARRLRPDTEVNPAYPTPAAPSVEPEIETPDPALSEISQTPKSQPKKTNKHTKKIILLSLVMATGVGVSLFMLLNLTIAASLFYATLTSATTFIITKTAFNTSSRSNLPAPPTPTPEEEEIIEADKPVVPLLSPKSTTEKANKKEEAKNNSKNNKDNKSKKMPPKPSKFIKALSKQPSTVFESSEDSEDSEILEEISPKRTSKRR